MKTANFIKSGAMISALILAGCAAQPEPLCNREAVEWDKYGTAEVPMECQPYTKPPGVVDDPHDPVNPPKEPPKEPPGHNPPKEPPEPPHEPPTKREGQNNGLGNGDQAAPGGSLDRNKAENEVGNPGHKSGKEQRSD